MLKQEMLYYMCLEKKEWQCCYYYGTSENVLSDGKSIYY